MGLTEHFKEEVEVIKKAPLTFIIGFVVIAGGVYVAEYSLFKDSLARKDDLIQTLQKQLDAKKPTDAPTSGTPARSAVTHGDNSPANTGNGNTFNSPPKSDQKKPQKR
jgi:hypothetical protein